MPLTKLNVIHCFPFGMTLGSLGPMIIASILTSTGALQGPLNSIEFKQNWPFGIMSLLGFGALHAAFHASPKAYKTDYYDTKQEIININVIIA